MENNNINKDPLTPSQRELVEKNHDLIYSYAHKNNISIDEYYDILAIGLCKAAKIYDENKGNFSTIAYCCMKNELNAYWRKTQNKSSIPDDCIVSYDEPDVRSDPDNQKAFLESLSDYESYNDMMYSVMSKDFEKKLNDKEKIIYNFILDGFSHTEIADKIGLKNATISGYVKQIRNKLVDYLNYN